MPKKYRVKLEASERDCLEEILKSGNAAALKQRHARILLKADENADHGGLSDSAIAEAVEISVPTVERLRRNFVEHGLETALARKDPDRVYLRKFDAKAEAQLLALACEDPPEGQQRWTLKLLAGKVVELEIVDSVCQETVRQTLKKTRSNPGRKNSGA